MYGARKSVASSRVPDTLLLGTEAGDTQDPSSSRAAELLAQPTVSSILPPKPPSDTVRDVYLNVSVATFPSRPLVQTIPDSSAGFRVELSSAPAFRLATAS